MRSFQARPPLIGGRAQTGCRAVVTVPVRNEQETLPATLASLHCQVDGCGKSLVSGFEVILLLNNCTDGSAVVAKDWCADNPALTVHLCEQTFAPCDAHVGTARSWLMDTAWQRLGGDEAPAGTAILTTDSDTEPAPDWVFRNLEAIAAGADAVGGVIGLNESELPEPARAAYLADADYQALAAELEHCLDPQTGDPWPRHLHHFGGSLACTPQAYARAGGMPSVTPLEDVAFVDRLRRIDARLRHDPAVRVHTSARLRGRVDVGLSGQLREWGTMPGGCAAHRVLSANYLHHRFTALGELRRFYRDECASGLRLFRAHGARLAEVRAAAFTCGEFLAAVDCNRLVDESLVAERESTIAEAISALRAMLA